MHRDDAATAPNAPWRPQHDRSIRRPPRRIQNVTAGLRACRCLLSSKSHAMRHAPRATRRQPHQVRAAIARRQRPTQAQPFRYFLPKPGIDAGVTGIAVACATGTRHRRSIQAAPLIDYANHRGTGIPLLAHRHVADHAEDAARPRARKAPPAGSCAVVPR